MTIPSERYKTWQKVAADQTAALNAGKKDQPLCLSLQNKIKVKSIEPITILSGEITLTQPCRLLFTGTVTGTCVNVFGITIYLDEKAVLPAKRSNLCHPDCCYTVSGNGRDNFQAVIPISLFSAEQTVGTHQVRLAVLSAWKGEAKSTWMNDRKANDIGNTSCLTVMPL